MNYQRKLDVQRRYAWSLPLTYKPNFLLKVSFLHTIIIVICRCYLFRRSISSSKKQVKSIFFNDSSSKSRSTETFSFVTSIIGINLRRTWMSLPLCNSSSWLTGKQKSDCTAEAQDITSLTVNLATFIAPLSLVTSTCSQEIFVFKHLTWSSELWVLFPRAAFPPLFTWVICFFSLERIPDFIISSLKVDRVLNLKVFLFILLRLSRCSDLYKG